MFDIGFTEILVIATISLLVIGPERLPETVRAVSMWIGRFKRSLRDTRREIEQQIGAEDIRRELHNEEVMRSLEKLRSEVSDTLEEKVDLEDDLYPPGHNDHDPNNSIGGDPARGKPGRESARPSGKAADHKAAAGKLSGSGQTEAKNGKMPAQDDSPSEPKNQ